MRENRRPGNDEVVDSVYRAFRRGQVAFILDQLTDDVVWDADWSGNSAQQLDVTYLRSRHGPADVAEYFAVLADWTFHNFRVLDIIGSGRQVVAEVEMDAVLPNGGRITDQELHLWTFDENGQVIRFRHYVDTAKHIAAHSGTDTTHGSSSIVTAFVLGQKGS